MAGVVQGDCDCKTNTLSLVPGECDEQRWCWRSEAEADR